MIHNDDKNTQQLIDQHFAQESDSPFKSDSLPQREIDHQLSQKAISYFPLATFILSFVFMGLLIASSNPGLVDFYQLPSMLLNNSGKIMGFTLLAIVAIYDTHRYVQARRKAAKQLDNIKAHLEKVWQSKKRQQQKANTFSGHTEKLKMFISDKLLEYIEYDEKFLHFKGIASEVRHNGVISYDKVITALNTAIEQQHFLSIYEQNNREQNGSEKDQPSSYTLDSTSKYQIAMDAMRYLWSLLDLSTADNMALHIGNQLIECEEHYYQLNLDDEKKLDITQSIPVRPTFHPQVAALMTLSLLTDEAEIRQLISLARLNQQVLEDDFILETPQFRIHLVNTPELLGNPNHIILLLENLIKNAQFFSQKVRYKQKTDRIGISLKPGNGFAQFTIYNRGPEIEEEMKTQIFKLGFSTRRTKQHHGKGLGLFFSSEIIKGYQGQIRVQNINFEPHQYLLSCSLASGEVKSFTLCSELNDDKIQVKESHADEGLSEWELTTDIPIKKLQIQIIGDNKAFTQDNISPESPFNWVDPGNFLQPRFQINVGSFRKHQKLSFKPLDIRGVAFEVKIPTAQSRLDELEIEFDSE